MPTTFEDRLLDELMSGTHHSPTARSGRPSIARRAAPIAAAAAMLGAGALIVTSHTDGASVAAGTTHHATITHVVKPTIDLTNTKAVLAAMNDAIQNSAYAHSVSHQTGPSGMDNFVEAWWQPDGYALRYKFTKDGVPEFDESFQKDGVGVSRYVNYETKQWGEKTDPGDFGIITEMNWKQEVTDGFLTVVGNDTIDGRAVTHLQHNFIPEANPPAGFNNQAAVQDIWVDSATFLPIKSSFDAKGVTTIETYDWVAQGDAKDSDLTPPIPDGFTHVDSPTPYRP